MDAIRIKGAREDEAGAESCGPQAARKHNRATPAAGPFPCRSGKARS